MFNVWVTLPIGPHFIFSSVTLKWVSLILQFVWDGWKMTWNDRSLISDWLICKLIDELARDANLAINELWTNQIVGLSINVKIFAKCIIFIINLLTILINVMCFVFQTGPFNIDTGLLSSFSQQMWMLCHFDINGTKKGTHLVNKYKIKLCHLGVFWDDG